MAVSSLLAHVSGIDLLPGFVCFIVGLFHELEMGIFSGIGVHLMIVLYHTARPGVTVEVKQVSGVKMT